MFNSRPTYLMELDAHVRVPRGIRDRVPEPAQLSNDELVSDFIFLLEQRVMGIVADELYRHGQRPRKRIKGHGRVQETGAKFTSNHAGEYHATFRVAFKGDHARAVSATSASAARIEPIGGIESISRLSLRGTDGTFHDWSQETREPLASSSPEMNWMIEEPAELATSAV